MTKLSLKLKIIAFLCLLMVLIFFQNPVLEQSPQSLVEKTSHEESGKSKIRSTNANLPLFFIKNEGQVHDKALFYANTSLYTLWVTEAGLVFDKKQRKGKKLKESWREVSKREKYHGETTYFRDVSRLNFIDSNQNPEVIPQQISNHKVNYFIGNDRSKWKTDIPTSSSIVYKNIYKNIDLKVYGVEKQIEYDWIIKPGGDVSNIQFEYKNVKKTRIDENGNLVVQTRLCELTHVKPSSYQVIKDKKVAVETHFKKTDSNTFCFDPGEYRRDYDLIIDPLVMVYSTYLGGTYVDYGFSIAVDRKGAAYITGVTASDDFPTENPFQKHNARFCDIFISKLNKAGTALDYSTYLGGYENENVYCITIDKKGAAYVTGWTDSRDFPTKNPLQSILRGSDSDAFIVKIGPKGNVLKYSTFLGGYYTDVGYGITVNEKGEAYVTGYTCSRDFPTQNPIQKNFKGETDAFVSKISSDGSNLVYSTHLGGSHQDMGFMVAVDNEDTAYVTGETMSVNFPTKNPIQKKLAGDFDAFVVKINPAGTAFSYSTYLGGSKLDNGHSIAIDKQGAVYIIGGTQSPDFPIVNPIQGYYGGGNSDAFVLKINPDGNALEYSTYLGGSNTDVACGSVAIDRKGAAYISGNTESKDFPKKNPLQKKYGRWGDAFIAKINPLGNQLEFSTYLGGSKRDSIMGMALDRKGAIYVTGETDSTDFPRKKAFQKKYAGKNDGFITKIKQK